MAQPGGRDIVERLARAIEAQDFDTIASLIAEDYVEENPQSGERIRGRANHQAILRNYPGGVGTVDPDSSRLIGSEDRWVVTPAFTVQRFEGSGDTYFYVASVRYPNGETWQILTLLELREGKVAKASTWYAAPFEAPAWRAPFVERFPALGQPS